MTKKIIAIFSLIFVEMISGYIIGFIPDPVSPETMQMLSSDPKYSMIYGQGESWLSIAQKSNDTARFWKHMEQIFLLAGLPALTGIVGFRII